MERLEGSDVGSWERWSGWVVMRWQGGKGARVVRWQGGRFLVLFKIGRHRVSPIFHLFVSDIDQQQNKVAR